MYNVTNKLGGQNKAPRLFNDKMYVNQFFTMYNDINLLYMKWLLKAFSCIGSVCYCIILSTFVVLYFPIFLAVFIFVTPFDKKRVTMYYVSKFYCFMIINLYPFLKIKITGGEKVDINKTYIIVSNHQSMMDIPLVGYSIPLIFRFVSKKEACRIPFFGWAIWLREDITVDRGSAKSAKNMILKSNQLISLGISVMIFPEGTRTKTGRVGRFKEGAFLLAKASSTPILPVVIKGTWEANNYCSKLLKMPTTFKLTILDPISKEEVDKMTIKELTSHTQSAISSAHREIEPQLYVEKSKLRDINTPN